MLAPVRMLAAILAGSTTTAVLGLAALFGLLGAFARLALGTTATAAQSVAILTIQKFLIIIIK